MLHQLVSKPSFVLDGAFLLTTPSISVHHKPPKLSTTIFHLKKNSPNWNANLGYCHSACHHHFQRNWTPHTYPNHLSPSQSISFSKNKKKQNSLPFINQNHHSSSLNHHHLLVNFPFKPPRPCSSHHHRCVLRISSHYSTISSPVSSLQSPNQANVYAFWKKK